MSVSVEQLVYASLSGNAGFNALIGNRFYELQLPQNPAYPCVAYQRISTVRQSTLDQGSGTVGVGWCRFQFTIWCRGPSAGEQADTVARAIQAAMRTFSAYQLPSSPYVLLSAPNIQLSDRAMVEPKTNPPLFKRMVDWQIFFQDQ